MRRRSGKQEKKMNTNPLIHTWNPDAELNFMGGISYRLNPLDTLKMISASSVFGEPQYYRDGDHAQATVPDEVCSVDRAFAQYSLRVLDPFLGMSTSAVMERAIDLALTYDYAGVLDWAAELRTAYLMRLTPQIIMVRAAVHPGRKKYTASHPGQFDAIEQQVMLRADDVIAQADYALFLRGTKRGLPAVLKRSWARRISRMDQYSMAKYARAGIGLIDVVRLCHAKGRLVSRLMRTGSLPMPAGENTWERMRAGGAGWQEILTRIPMPHMALLRNLRGIFSEVEDAALREKVLARLIDGVRSGKQFPFRYLSAWKAIGLCGGEWTRQAEEALDRCALLSCGNLPALPGKSAFLSDNSGSAWGTCTSEYGTMQIAEIGNMSAVLGAMRAEDGYVFTFGNALLPVPIDPKGSPMRQIRQANSIGKGCGMATENGIWLFFREAIFEHQHWDNIFIYSDMQAGHGGLYSSDWEAYRSVGCSLAGEYIDVNALIALYRQRVNPKVNVCCIQTAGYTNALVPEYGYRTAVLCGWTGRELVFADILRKTWDAAESGPRVRTGGTRRAEDERIE